MVLSFLLSHYCILIVACRFIVYGDSDNRAICGYADWLFSAFVGQFLNTGQFFTLTVRFVQSFSLMHRATVGLRCR